MTCVSFLRLPSLNTVLMYDTLSTIHNLHSPFNRLLKIAWVRIYHCYRQNIVLCNVQLLNVLTVYHITASMLFFHWLTFI